MIKIFGLNRVLLDIFGLEFQFSNDCNESNCQLKILCKVGYSKIKRYFNKPVNQVSVELLIGIFKVLHYGTLYELRNLYDKIDQTILSNTDLILGLDQIPCIRDYLNEQQYQIYLKLMDCPLSYNLIYDLSYSFLRYKEIFKEIRLCEVSNLLLRLAKLHPKDFKQWYDTTRRHDLKVLYIDTVLNNAHTWAYLLAQQNVLDIRIVIPDIFIVKACYFIIRFHIGIEGTNIGSLLSNTSIKDINNEEYLSMEEKLCFILCYFGHVKLETKDFSIKSSIENDLNFFAENFDYLDSNIIQECLGKGKVKILYRAICCVKDKIKKNDLLGILAETFDKDIKEANNLAINIFERADLHAEVLIKIGDGIKNVEKIDGIKNVEKIFEKKYHEINFPYLVYTNNMYWSNNISKLMYCFRIIFIFYCSKDMSKINQYREKFIEVKMNHEHGLDRQFNDTLQEIELSSNLLK